MEMERIRTEVKVLWLSRHEMTSHQRMNLHQLLGLGREMEVVHMNATFPSPSREAVKQIEGLLNETGSDVLAGVFPAHIAASMARNPLCMTFLPVSVPAPAVEGETRGGGFIHSHWEYFS